MHSYDLCFAWSWPYDDYFAYLLSNACQERQISHLQVTPSNLDVVLQNIASGELHFRAYFDRASDGDEKFTPLSEWANRQDIEYINRFWLARRAWDKATMHHQFTRSGLDAPYTIILPSNQESPELPLFDLNQLGENFVIKPAHGGGGSGVVIGPLTWEQILGLRKQNPLDQYLLQSVVIPCVILNRPAWFRLIYCLESIYPCWWDPITHIYTPFSAENPPQLRADALLEICRQIARLTHLELFSTEIAITESNRFMVVDYVNDPIDLRPKSIVNQGVPDQILAQIAQELSAHVAALCSKGPTYAG